MASWSHKVIKSRIVQGKSSRKVQNKMFVRKLQQPTVVLAAEKNTWSLETDVLKSYSV